MSEARAKLWARLIYKGIKTIDDVAEDDQDTVREAYRTLYNEEI